MKTLPAIHAQSVWQTLCPLSIVILVYGVYPLFLSSLCSSLFTLTVLFLLNVCITGSRLGWKGHNIVLGSQSTEEFSPLLVWNIDSTRFFTRQYRLFLQGLKMKLRRETCMYIKAIEKKSFIDSLTFPLPFFFPYGFHPLTCDTRQNYILLESISSILSPVKYQFISHGQKEESWSRFY